MKNIIVKFVLRQLSKIPSGKDESRDYNRMHGKWYVLYPDGLRSGVMCLDVARDYRSIFGGEVKYKQGSN